MAKVKLFSVGIDDCRVDTFTVGGNGGGGKDTSSTGVRIVHPPSGAVGRATDSRSQLGNKRLAFKRMALTPTFQSWAKFQAALLAGGKSIDTIVEEDMDPKNLKIEVKDTNGKWTREDTQEN